MNYINGIDPRLPPGVEMQNNESGLEFVKKTNNIDCDIEMLD